MKIVRAIVSKIKLSGFSKAGARSAAPKVNLASVPDTFTLSWEARMSKTVKKKTFVQKIKDSFFAIRYCLSGIPKPDKKTIQYLNSLPEQKFLEESRRIICEARGIPQSLYPVFMHAGNLPDSLAAQYNFARNVVQYNPAKCHNSRAVLFSTFVHEITHQKQNLDILRTQKLGAKHIDMLSRLNALDEVNVVKSLSVEQIEKILASDTNQKAYFDAMIQAKRKGIEAEKAFLDRVYKDMYNMTYSFWSKCREKAVKEMGVIPINSRQARMNLILAKALYPDKTAGKMVLNGSRIYETTAYTAQLISGLRYNAKEMTGTGAVKGLMDCLFAKA